MKIPTKGYPYVCPLCKKQSYLLMKPSRGLAFACFNCDETLMVEKIIYFNKDRSGPFGMFLTHVSRDELQKHLESGVATQIDFDREEMMGRMGRMGRILGASDWINTYLEERKHEEFYSQF